MQTLKHNVTCINTSPVAEETKTDEIQEFEVCTSTQRILCLEFVSFLQIKK